LAAQSIKSAGAALKRFPKPQQSTAEEMCPKGTQALLPLDFLSIRFSSGVLQSCNVLLAILTARRSILVLPPTP